MQVSLDDLLPEVVQRADLVVVDDWGLVSADHRRLFGRMYRQRLLCGPGDGPAAATNVLNPKVAVFFVTFLPLCMELPWPRDQKLAEPGQSLVKSVLRNEDGRYRRRHPIAAICSSDCKRLEPDAEQRNYIGYRHTWVKVGRPSIEGLRQAFLDHESRIRFGEQRPEATFTYPKITRLSVTDAAFLDDQEIVFSPNMTTLIGGGGTGKSTIIEYLRASLGQAGTIHADDVRRNHERIMRTVESQTRVRLTIEREGTTWDLESSAGGVAETVEAEAIPDLARFFPVRVYGQREIYAIADDRKARARLVDNLVRSELDELQRAAAERTTEVRHLDEEMRARLREESTDPEQYAQRCVEGSGHMRPKPSTQRPVGTGVRRGRSGRGS